VTVARAPGRKRRADGLSHPGKRARVDPGDSHMLQKLRQLPADGERQGSAQSSGQADDAPASSGEAPGAPRPRRPALPPAARPAARGARATPVRFAAGGARRARVALAGKAHARPCEAGERVHDRPARCRPTCGHARRAALERPRSAAEEAAERGALRGAWELASVLEFLEVFHAQLGLPDRRCSAAELEAALVLSPGGPGVLADLHVVRHRG